MPNRFDFAIVGAGIIGLAHAYHLNKAGKSVIVYERGHRALGASVRNLGMIWPIGQPVGEMREMALQSREIWLQVLKEAGLWHAKTGSLHLAYFDDEVGVLEEFVDKVPSAGATMVGPARCRELSPVVRAEGLKGGMWSPHELCVDPREVTAKLPEYLTELGVEFRFGTAVTNVDEVPADRTILCTGEDFETLYPDLFSRLGMTRVKLQMLKARFRQAQTRIGTHLCAGLTLGHYKNFQICDRLAGVVDRFSRDYPEHEKWGVHLLVSQHEGEEITIGDSHEYGISPDPFLQEEIDRLILGYLDTFMTVDQIEITQRWMGVYVKHASRNYIVERPAANATIVTGVGGAGMTLSFGLAKQVVESL